MIVRWTVLLFCGWLAGTVSGAAGFGGALILLPILAAMRGKAAVPILTVAQLLGNLSRAGFGWRDIRWRPAVIFMMGSIPSSILGCRLFVDLPSGLVLRLIGVLILILIAIRHTARGRRAIPEWLLMPAGAGVGFLSALAGSAGPLGAATFLGLNLPARAYVASEAVTAVFLHLTKSITYGRYAALTLNDCLSGLALGGSLVLGSWTGRKLIDRLPERRYAPLIELLLAVSSISLLLG